MSTQVKSTANYDLFELHNFNRDVGRLKYLESSMKKHGWLDPYPMHVVKNGNGKLKIKGGHHRFITAMALNIPVKYVVSDDSASIHELEKATNKWTIRDYLESHARTGNENYRAVKAYHEKTGIPISVCIAMLGGQSASSVSNKIDIFKEGRFKVTGSQHANAVARIIMSCNGFGIDCAKADLFIKALSKMLFLPEFSQSHFIKKAKTFKSMFSKRPDLEGYMRMIEDVYNRASREKLPLAFMATEASKERSAVKRG